MSNTKVIWVLLSEFREPIEPIRIRGSTAQTNILMVLHTVILGLQSSVSHSCYGSTRNEEQAELRNWEAHGNSAWEIEKRGSLVLLRMSLMISLSVLFLTFQTNKTPCRAFSQPSQSSRSEAGHYRDSTESSFMAFSESVDICVSKVECSFWYLFCCWSSVTGYDRLRKLILSDPTLSEIAWISRTDDPISAAKLFRFVSSLSLI
jgi:hypothetical protein